LPVLLGDLLNEGRLEILRFQVGPQRQFANIISVASRSMSPNSIGSDIWRSSTTLESVLVIGTPDFLN
jgi:hypothetical protein